MSYEEAKRRIRIKRLLGIAMLAVALPVTAISLLKFLYFGLDDGGLLFAGIALSLKRMVYVIYERTQFLSLVWAHAPIPDLQRLVSTPNFWFLVSYLSIFVGMAIFRSGNELAARLRRIEMQIEDELIRFSMRSGERRTREEMQESIEIRQSPVWGRIHELYLAPVVVGLILAVAAKLLGLV
jgi:hypothetical protein